MTTSELDCASHYCKRFVIPALLLEALSATAMNLGVIWEVL
jgi:hypothetical protein